MGLAASERLRRWCIELDSSPTAQIWMRRALVAYVVAVFLIRIHHAGDFAGYLAVGEHILRGEHPYRSAGAFNTWPPFFNLLCVPLALLARPTAYVARALWFVLNFACVWWILRLCAMLVYNRRLTWAPGQGLAVSSPWIFVPLLLSERYVSSNFDHVQINLILFALVLAGLTAQREGRWLNGGLLVGLAAAIKLMPVTFVAYFAWRRRWAAFWSSLVAFLGLSFSPALVFGWGRFWDYVIAWHERVAGGWGVGRLNQSVWAMWDRWLGHGMVPLLTPGAHDIASSGSPVVTVAVFLTLVSFGLAFWRRARVANPGCWQQVAEWSVVFLATAVFSPVTWKAYLAVSVLPAMLLFAAWWHAPISSSARRGASLGLVAAALPNLLSPGFLGRNLAGRLEMACVPTVFALLLVAALIWLLPYLPALEAEAKRKRAAEEAEA
ncbi:MAG: hypothetical protein KatS3mg077_0677 [Candidatus Binatia bacterium]|nr:MAG: hypothetical protein KatS3mg077_0677 [Candidatus Binatia bacterium]